MHCEGFWQHRLANCVAATYNVLQQQQICLTWLTAVAFKSIPKQTKQLANLTTYRVAS